MGRDILARKLLDGQLQFDPEIEIERISKFIAAEVKRRGVRGAAIGFSGGLDSTTCACLCARSLRRSQIHMLSLPERDSNPTIYGHAHAAAQALGLALEEHEMSDLFARFGLYQGVSPELAANRPLLERAMGVIRRLSGSPALFPWAQEYAFGRRRGLPAWILRRWLWPYAQKTEIFILGKTRLRMLALTLRAAQLDCLLLCTTDRSEWSVGFYDPQGDGVGDLAPLRHLYKTQIRELARALGVADEILRQPSSGDLAAGLPNETVIGLPYLQLDRTLAGLALGMEVKEIAAGAGVSRAMVRAVSAAGALAEQRRQAPKGLARP